MKKFTFKPEGVENCEVTAYVQENQGHMIPGVVICPGGGYHIVSEREAEPVAKEYFAAGYQVFVLTYSVGVRAKNFEPLCQLATTMAHIRANAEEFCVDKDKIAVCGFSAGGHLAGSLGTLYNEEKFLQEWKRTDNIRPDAMILCYPVILADEYAHKASIKNVSGAEVGSEEYQWFSLEKHVDEMTPPTFLWHTASDGAVPVQNSLCMANALSLAKVPVELHVFPEGNHGMSVCTSEVGNEDLYVGRWVEWSITWLSKIFEFKK